MATQAVQVVKAHCIVPFARASARLHAALAQPTGPLPGSDVRELAEALLEVPAASSVQAAQSSFGGYGLSLCLSLSLHLQAPQAAEAINLTFACSKFDEAVKSVRPPPRQRAHRWQPRH